MAFKIKQLLTRPLLKFEVGVPRHVLLEGEMFIGKEMPAAEGKKKMEPATLVNVIDLDSGEPAQIIVNAVVASTLKETYTEKGVSYVGKAFQITKQARQAGKQYDKFSIAEIEMEVAAPAASDTPAPPVASPAASDTPAPSAENGTPLRDVSTGGRRK